MSQAMARTWIIDAIQTIRKNGTCYLEEGRLNFRFRDAYDPYVKHCEFVDQITQSKADQYPKGSIFVVNSRQSLRTLKGYICFRCEELAFNWFRNINMVPRVFVLEDYPSAGKRQSLADTFDRFGDDQLPKISCTDILLRLKGVYKKNTRVVFVFPEQDKVEQRLLITY